MLAARGQDIARIAYSLKSLLTSWLLALLAWYSAKFIGRYKGENIELKPYRYLLIFVLAVNTFIMISNAFAPTAAEIRPQWLKGELFYTFSPLGPLYYVYVSLTAVLIAINCHLFYCANFSVPKVYWQKYRALITFFFAGVIIAALLRIFRFNYIDFYVLTFGMFSYHVLSAQFHPPRFSSEINSLLVDSSANAVLVFDSKSMLALYNKKSCELFSLTEDMLGKLSYEEFAERNSIGIELPRNGESGFFYDVERDGKRIYFFARCSRIYDKKGLFVGTFFIFEDETVQRKLLGKQRFLEKHDHLTGIFNRSTFSIETEAMLRNDPDTDYLFVQFDIDNFRIINQLFGSRAGNSLLQAIAEFLKGYVRKGTYARLEGDHFAVCAPVSEINIEELSRGISRCADRIGISLPVRARFGIYKVEDRSLPVEQMYDMAVMASKAVKGNYSEYFAYYDEHMRDSILMEQEIIGQMEQALKDNQFEIYLQPQYNYISREIVGAEVLVRWHHPEKGIILPKTFVPIFEKNGFITQLDCYVWERTCQLLREWSARERPLSRMPLSINISRLDFSRLNLCAVLKELVEKYGIEPKKLRLEVTETACMENHELMIDIIRELQRYGFTVEMDDFGSGYSSLNILKDMPVNALKLDMHFLSGKGDIKKGYTILHSIAEMASRISLNIIAEGVESREQADFLHSIGCNIMQGYYYSPPLRVEDFERKVKLNNSKIETLR